MTHIQRAGANHVRQLGATECSKCTLAFSSIIDGSTKLQLTHSMKPSPAPGLAVSASCANIHSHSVQVIYVMRGCIAAASWCPELQNVTCAVPCNKVANMGLIKMQSTVLLCSSIGCECKSDVATRLGSSDHCQ